VLALVAASVWILTWIYPHCPLEVFVQVALFMGAYLVYKLYKLIDKLLRKKPFKHDIGTIHRRTTHDTRGTHTRHTTFMAHTARARHAHTSRD
jgi:hypothetical protein